MSKSIFNWVIVLALVLGSMANASTILWVNEVYDTDVDGQQDDQLFIDWLVDQGYHNLGKKKSHARISHRPLHQVP